MNDPEYLTPKQASDELQVSLGTVLAHIKCGDLRAVNLGKGRKRKLYRIDRQALQDFIDQRTTKPARTVKAKSEPVKNWFANVTGNY